MVKYQEWSAGIQRNEMKLFPGTRNRCASPRGERAPHRTGPLGNLGILWISSTCSFVLGSGPCFLLFPFSRSVHPSTAEQFQVCSVCEASSPQLTKDPSPGPGNCALLQSRAPHCSFLHSLGPSGVRRRTAGSGRSRAAEAQTGALGLLRPGLAWRASLLEGNFQH